MTVLWSKCDLSVSKTTLYHLVHLSVIISLWDSESLQILRASVSWTNEIEVKPEKKNTPLSDYVQTADLKVEKNNFAVTFDNFAKLVLHPVVLLWNPETSSNTHNIKKCRLMRRGNWVRMRPLFFWDRTEHGGKSDSFQMGNPVLPPQGLHSCVHHRAGPSCQTQHWVQ